MNEQLLLFFFLVKKRKIYLLMKVIKVIISTVNYELLSFCIHKQLINLKIKVRKNKISIFFKKKETKNSRKIINRIKSKK